MEGVRHVEHTRMRGARSSRGQRGEGAKGEVSIWRRARQGAWAGIAIVVVLLLVAFAAVILSGPAGAVGAVIAGVVMILVGAAPAWYARDRERDRFAYRRAGSLFGG